MTDSVIKNFFWLHAPSPAKTQRIAAACRDNRITITTSTNVTVASVLLDSRLIDFTKPVTLDLNGKISKRQLKPSLLTLCQTLIDRGDQELAFTVGVDLPLRPMPTISGKYGSR